MYRLQYQDINGVEQFLLVPSVTLLQVEVTL